MQLMPDSALRQAALEIEGIVFTLFDGRTTLTAQVRAEVERYFKDRVFATVIPRNVRLSEAPSHGRSILQYDLRSPGAIAYLELAKAYELFAGSATVWSPSAGSASTAASFSTASFGLLGSSDLIMMGQK